MLSPLAKQLAATWLVTCLIQTIDAFEDNFDGNRSDRWTHFDPIAEVQLAGPSTFAFEDGVFRMEANPPAADPAGPARVFSYIDDEIYSDFYCAVDVVDWNDEINQAFGILGRVDNVGLGQTTGYVCNYDPNQTGGQPGGQFQINRVVDEASAPTIAIGNVKLLDDHSYRFVFRGEGNRLIGAIYDLLDLTAPVVQIETDGDQNPDAVTFTEGRFGLFCFYRGGDLTEDHARPTVTFDNFIVQEANPAPELLPGIDRGGDSRAQFVSHTPVSEASFHPAAEGLRVTVRQPEVKPQAISLTLNGEAVPSDAIAYTTENGLTEGFFAGLDPNQIYEARAELGGVASVWHFDTFEESLLDSGEAIVVEAEDYNFGAGQFLDQPAAGGATEAGAVLPNADASYYDRTGEIEIDYHDTEGGPVGENDYRVDDFVGLRSGSQEIEPGPLLRDAPRARHTETGARDYEVFHTEAGEWMNYTRTFPDGDYHVYLRAASQASQDLLLDRVTSDATRPNQTTEPVGRFALANQVSRFTWRFTPLTDNEGEPLTVPLSGETTLRLTMGGEESAFEFRRVLALNYLLFVPVSQDDPNLVVARSGLFGEVAGAETASLTLRNRGATEPLIINEVLLEGEDAAHFTFVEPPATLLPDEAAAIDISFAPNGREGVFLAKLVIATNDESNPEIRVELTASIPVSSGLLVHYPFDDAAGSTIATDTSGNRRNGAYVSEAGATLQLGQEGLAGGTALRLDNGSEGGGGAHVEIPIAARLPVLEALTVSLWFQQDAGASNVTILSKGLEPADPFALALDQQTLAWGAAGESVFQTEAAYSAETPHHLVIRYENGATSIFIDGAVSGQAPEESPVFVDRSPSPFLIGALSGGVLGFSGVLDDFQLYERSLTDEEVAFLHANPGTALGETESPDSDGSVSARIVADEGPTYRLVVDGPAGRTYTLEASTSLLPDSWATIGEFEATEAMLTIDLSLEDAAVRFYRLRY